MGSQPGEIWSFPADAGEVYPSLAIKNNSLGLQQFSLPEPYRADAPLAVDDPMPGDIAPCWQYGHGTAYLAGIHPVAHHGSDLPIGRYSPAWDLAN
jgi:hypothetical protein